MQFMEDARGKASGFAHTGLTTLSNKSTFETDVLAIFSLMSLNDIKNWTRKG